MPRVVHLHRYERSPRPTVRLTGATSCCAMVTSANTARSGRRFAISTSITFSSLARRNGHLGKSRHRVPCLQSAQGWRTPDEGDEALRMLVRPR